MQQNRGGASQFARAVGVFFLCGMPFLAGCGGGGGGSDSPSSAVAVPADVAAKVANQSESTIELSWQAAAGAVSYQIWRSGNGSNSALIKTTVATDFVDSNLASNTGYSYLIKACSASACSAGFTIQANTAAPATNAPAAPVALNLASAADISLTFSWGSVAGASYYVVMRNGWQIGNGASLTQTTFTDTGLNPNTAYQYTIQACNSAGCSPASTPITLTTTATGTAPVNTTPVVSTGPAAPAVPTALVTSGNSVSVSWAAVSGASNYVLSRNGAQIGGNTLTGISFVDTGLVAGTAYTYTLQACNANGCSLASPGATVTIGSTANINITTTGLDTTVPGNNVQFKVWGYEGGNVVGQESSSSNGTFTSFVTTQTGHGYYAAITAQPANGQKCTISPTSSQIAGSSNVAVNVNCVSPAQLSFANPSAAAVANMAPDIPQLATVSGPGNTALSSNAVQYSSSNPAVATVDPVSGAVTALQPGSATIAASLPASLYTANTASYTLNVTANAAAAQVQMVEVAQVIAQPSQSAYQILVPGRDVLVRAYVYANSASNTAPPQVVADVRGSIAQTTLTCPASVPLASTVTSGTYTLSYNLAQTCYGTLPASQIKPGIWIDVSTSLGQVTHLHPNVNSNNTMNVSLIPLTINGKASQNPQAADVVTAMLRTMPFATVNVDASHLPFTPTGTFSDGLTGSGQWGDVLGQVNSLRVAENAKSTYYGFVPGLGALSVIGLGYVGAPAAIGVDTRISNAVNNTMMHELGHTLSLSHAPCGGAGGPDPFFSSAVQPWPNASSAQLSAAPLLNQALGLLSSPGVLGSRSTDLMGYCGGTWFSEYSYHKIAGYVQANSAYQAAPQMAAMEKMSVPSSNMMLIGGSLNTDGSVSLQPVHLLGSAREASVPRGNYQLRLIASDGSASLYRFTPLQLDHETAGHFAVVLPAVANLASIDVLKDGVLLPVRKAAQPLAARAKAAGVGAVGAQTELADVVKQGNTLQISWNAGRYPWLSVLYLGQNGKRTMLAMHATGGALSVPVSQYAGGSFVISLSDGLNGVMKTVNNN